MKNNKAPGNDNITKEMIEACGDIGISKLVTIMNKIYESGYIPQQMKESIFIRIPKKGDLLNSERNIKMQQDVYAAFIDYKKAFDRVKHIEIMKDLQEIGIDGKYIRVLKNLYWEQMAAIPIDSELSE